MMAARTRALIFQLLVGLLAASGQLARVDMPEGAMDRALACNLDEGVPCDEVKERFCCTLEEEEEETARVTRRSWP
eukprot:g17975.t1